VKTRVSQEETNGGGRAATQGTGTEETAAPAGSRGARPRADGAGGVNRAAAAGASIGSSRSPPSRSQAAAPSSGAGHTQIATPGSTRS